MEVIVDDTQLSLAIGKKGQNVRLAAKLLGWRIDIKSEEEKRQEVESQMAALVVPGAPVSVLLDHGLSRSHRGKIDAQAAFPRWNGSASMTPEELEAVPGVDPEMVERIQTAVNSYYGQFEGPTWTKRGRRRGWLRRGATRPMLRLPRRRAGTSPPRRDAAGTPENESVTIGNAEVR